MQAVIREGKEEVGVDVQPKDLTLIHVVSRKGNDAERVGFFFRAEAWEGTPMIMEKDKCDDLQWFALDAIPENTVDYVKQAIATFRVGKPYSEFGWKFMKIVISDFTFYRSEIEAVKPVVINADLSKVA